MLSSLEAERVLAEMSPREREVTGLLANGLSNAAIVERLGLSERTVQGRGRTVRFDEAFEAKIAELASGAPPEGVQAWTLRLLAEKAVEAGWVDSVSPMTIHRILKKRNLTLTPGA